MKKAMIWLVLSVLLLSSSAQALDAGDWIGGFTSMFSLGSAKTYGPQEKAELDEVNIELINVMERSESSEMFELEEGYEYLLIEFEIENKSEEELAISTVMNFSTWCDDELCGISVLALALGRSVGKPQLDCYLASGESISGVIGYEVPQDWERITVVYKHDIFGGENATFVVEKPN